MSMWSHRDIETLHARLCFELPGDRAARWIDSVCNRSRGAIHDLQHGNLPTWQSALSKLPRCPATVTTNETAVCVDGEICDDERRRLPDTLRAFHPWRKGPFEIFGVGIDTEWRSNLKWDRIAPHLQLRDARVLDVGCGNGYYGWRMLDAGARLVLGLEPFLLYLMQFEVVRRHAEDRAHFILPLSDSALTPLLELFDVTFSMGVLYHCRSPIDHLQSLWHSLKPGGTLVLETLIVESADVLVPADRYAKMRNVWFIPSIAILRTWLSRVSFRDVEVLDVARTTTDEQRRTEWMTFESLADFLDPHDSTCTIEGYPGPVRAVLVAHKPA